MKYKFQNQKYAFTVCRIEPENNIHLILEAFASDAPFPVVAVGNYENGEFGRRLREKYQNNPDIFMLDPIYDTLKLNELRSHCTVYLHGHSCGGTNPSLVEAMYLALPIIAFDVNFNRETTENQAFYFSSSSELNTLCSTLSREELQETAHNMKTIADRRYTWERISKLYAKLF
ncbi:MAG: glycosyltransferase [Victivallales bacterium]|nr:glycosyltransferase [Victivallales bacterium]